MDKTWMIYGANGYTGTLVAREAVRRGMRPLLAGRNAEAVKALADELGLAWRCFDLQGGEVLHNLSGMALVLNCAGPFSKTVRPLLRVCIEAHCHYLDISGELEVFQHCFEEHSRAEQAGIIVCPGVAFDIVPTEAVAVRLQQLLPDATYLKLGFDGQMALSKGSSITLLEGVGNPALSVYMVRENGQLRKLTTPRMDKMAFAPGKMPSDAMAITWADLNGAFYSTHIPDISVYVPATWLNRISFAGMTWMKPLLGMKSVQSTMKNLIKRMIDGPGSRDLESGCMQIAGEAGNRKGDKIRIFLKVAHGYKFTYLAALGIVGHCLDARDTQGYKTPSMLMGTDFVQTLDGSSEYQVEQV